ncbi:putative bifunctional diguanylate cyclase/phosphodiesterase [Paenibacillus gansuensis]|uniref:Bifunctional diguanylate cyclase/phosphodiesterase n=1 Tax=Paenibacillus gansuensis TaxID=306542 RepID=A0ABW5PE04_9BACL
MNSTFANALLFVLFLVPIVFLFDTAMVIIKRNPRKTEYRLAFTTVFLLTLLLIFECIQQLLPIDYTNLIALYMVYPCVFLSAGTSLLFHLHQTGFASGIRYGWKGTAAFVPFLTYTAILVIWGEPALLSASEQQGIWNVEMFAEGLMAVMIELMALSLCNLLVTWWAVRKSESNLERLRSRVLFRTNLIFQASVILLITVTEILKPWVTVPSTFIFFMTALWGVCLRILMNKYQLWPSVETRYRALYQISPAAIVMMDRYGMIQDANPRAVHLFGTRLQGKAFAGLLDPSDRERFLHRFLTDFPHAALLKEEYSFTNAQGRQVSLLLDTEIIRSSDEWYLLGVLQDISRMKEEEARLEHMAHHDSLTQLPNRLFMEKELTSAIQAAKERRHQLSVILIDLDRFKIINDTLGHIYGDEALCKIAYSLQKVMGEDHRMARLGGDEFIVLLPEVNEYEQVIDCAERILQVFKEPLLLQGQEFFLGGSMGISVYPFDGTSAESLIRHADMAMYYAKKNGGDQYRLHNKELNESLVQEMQMERHLRYAIKEQEFTLVYQPQVNLQTRQMYGVEALIRWNSAALGAVSPEDFIPVAEKNGLIVPIGEWVVQEACRQAKLWQDSLPVPLTVSLNVSAKQLRQPNFAEMVMTAIQASGVNPKLLCLEITESSVVNHLESAKYMLEELIRIGVDISIDDFGTGYSSLSVLTQLPISSIKIDRSFISSIEHQHDKLEIAKAIITMGHGIHKRIVAEGVENVKHYQILKELRCDTAQGYFFGKPVPPRELENLLFTSLRNYVECLG